MKPLAILLAAFFIGLLLGIGLTVALSWLLGLGGGGAQLGPVLGPL